jgi:hypothetical protein
MHAFTSHIHDGVLQLGNRKTRWNPRLSDFVTLTGLSVFYHQQSAAQPTFPTGTEARRLRSTDRQKHRSFHGHLRRRIYDGHRQARSQERDEAQDQGNRGQVSRVMLARRPVTRAKRRKVGSRKRRARSRRSSVRLSGRCKAYKQPALCRIASSQRLWSSHVPHYSSGANRSLGIGVFYLSRGWWPCSHPPHHRGGRDHLAFPQRPKHYDANLTRPLAYFIQGSVEFLLSAYERVRRLEVAGLFQV